MSQKLPSRLGLFACGISGLLCLTPGKAMGQNFSVDFSKWTSGPMLKDKFGVYQTPLKPQKTIERASRFLNEAGAQDMRYETGIGKPGALAYDQVSGTANNLQYEFSSIDQLVRSWKHAGAHPLLAFTYDPLPLQPSKAADAWKDVPSSLSGWSSVNQAYASHLLEKERIPGIFYEQWNEPDLPDGNGGKVFFNGTASDYGNVFQYGLAGVRSGAPDALVGGPAAAYDLAYLDTIWPQHPDFVSIHAYGNYREQLDNLRGHNGDVVFTPTVPMFLTEYNSYTTFGLKQPTSLHQAAASFFHDVNGMLSISDAVKVYWAQWVDDSLGMLTDDLHKKALYNAYAMYQTMLPVDRSPVIPATANAVGTMAGVDPHNAAIVLYNNGGRDATTTVQMNNLPFAGGVGEVYLIDAQHASYLDGAPEDLVPSKAWTFNANSTSQTVTVKAQSVALLKVRDGSGESLLREARLGQYVRSEYNFFNRIFTFEDDMVADLDPHTSIARLGMATTTSTSNFGIASTANVYDHPVHRFTVTVNKQGPFSKNDNNSVFGLRVEYQSTSGKYTHSVLFHNGLYDPTRTSGLPWGEGTPVPDQAVLEEGMNTGQPFTVDLQRYAPADWNGKRVLIAPILQNAGYGSYARMILRPVPLRRFVAGNAGLVDVNAASCQGATTAETANAARVNSPLPACQGEKENTGAAEGHVSGLVAGQTYNLRLQFAETSQGGPQPISVLVNGEAADDGLSVGAATRGVQRAPVKQITAVADAGGTIQLRVEVGSPDLAEVEVF